MASPILDLTSPKDALPPSTTTRQGSNALGKDEFLKLLVAQLANQDPTKPQDSSQFVAQLAQFSALEQQQNTVSRLDTLLLGQATANQTQASSFIGKDVSFRGSSIHVDGQSGGSATASLSATAKLTVNVVGPGGENVRNLDLGTQAPGDVVVKWDGRDTSGVLMPAGDYTFKASAFDAENHAVAVNVRNTGSVTGVAFEGGLPVLKVGGSLVKMSDVTSINERKSTP